VTDQTGISNRTGQGVPKPATAGPVRNPSGSVEFPIRGSAIGPGGFRFQPDSKPDRLTCPGGILNWAGQFRNGLLSNPADPVRFQSRHGPLSNRAGSVSNPRASRVRNPTRLLGRFTFKPSCPLRSGSKPDRQTRLPPSNIKSAVRFQSGFKPAPRPGQVSK
jgi:hypothetical protein